MFGTYEKILKQSCTCLDLRLISLLVCVQTRKIVFYSQCGGDVPEEPEIALQAF